MNILFVCIKNASRSPMAEALLKMLARRGVTICSAGIKPGKEVNEQAVKVMREIGCDLSGREPRHISAFSDIKFDYVAKMDVPDLGDMVTAKWIADWDIPDPAQGGITEYRKIRQLIADKICAELPHLLERRQEKRQQMSNLQEHRFTARRTKVGRSVRENQW